MSKNKKNQAQDNTQQRTQQQAQDNTQEQKKNKQTGQMNTENSRNR